MKFIDSNYLVALLKAEKSWHDNLYNLWNDSMKQSLLALAVIGAFANAAHAQSSVTVYGLLDLAYTYQKQKLQSLPLPTRAPLTACGRWCRAT
ncbi:porin [Undibacterium arcticum]